MDVKMLEKSRTTLAAKNPVIHKKRLNSIKKLEKIKKEISQQCRKKINSVTAVKEQRR